MRRRRGRVLKATQSVSIPITPLIDIVFLLLIYFMLASNFIEEQQFVVDLPRSSKGDARTKGPIVVTLKRNGGLFIDGKEASETDLRKRLKQLSPKAKQEGLEVRAEQDVAVRRVVKIMDMAKEAGVKKVMITTQKDTS